MYFSPAFVLAALPFLVSATPVADGVEARSASTTGIPLFKRSALRNQDGTVNTKMLRTSVSRSVSYVSHFCPVQLFRSYHLASFAGR